MAPARERAKKELADVDREISRFVEALAIGGDMTPVVTTLKANYAAALGTVGAIPAVTAALRDREALRLRLQEQLAGLTPPERRRSNPSAPLDSGRISAIGSMTGAVCCAGRRPWRVRS
jgi:hypothetical protein